jgi:CSLREA domain-containing protein
MLKYFCKTVLWLGILFGGAMFASDASAATRTVDTTADNGALTACTAAANDCSLRGAITNAASDDTIDFSPTVFATPQTINLATNISIFGKSLQINGPGANLVTVDAVGLNRLFFINHGATARTISIRGLTLNGGDVSDNIPFEGGVILHRGTAGAVFSLDGVVVTGGEALDGGGLYFENGTYTITNSIIYNNISYGSCGGVLVKFGGHLTITNSTVSGNTSVQNGGGICNQGSTVIVRKSTITLNQAGSGGGIHNYLFGHVTLGNSIVAGNTGVFANPRHDLWNELHVTTGSPFTDEGYNVIGRLEGVNDSGVVITAGTPNANNDYAGTNAAPVNALLGALAGNGGPTPTHALLAGSPALDRGSAVGGITTDQRGLARPFDNIYIASPAGGDGSDIGAFEAQTSLNAAPTVAAQPGVTRGLGSNAVNSPIAAVTDPESAASVTVALTSANPSNGITVSNIVNTGGAVTADVAAACAATPASFTLTATDSGGATATALLAVNLSANTAPTLQYPASFSVGNGASLNAAPTVAADNGTLSYSIFNVSPPLTTAPTVDSGGVVSITGTQPLGAHLITVRATDNCGLTTDASFTLNVVPPEKYVTKIADTNDGVCDSDCSLREAIAAAANGDTVFFAAPLFDTAQTITLGSELSVAGKTITIAGRGATLTAISGNNLSRVFNVAANGNLTLNNLTVTGGFDPSLGGGIYNAGTLKITGSAISGNAVAGGSDNYGGGIFNGTFATLTISGSTISGNTVSGNGNFSNRGGGLANDNGFLTITGSTVSGNSAVGGTNNRGGGIYSQFRDLTIIGVTIAGNTAGTSGFSYGGGLATSQDTVILANTIISGNSAPNNPNLLGSLNTSNFNLIDGDPRLAPLGYYGGPTRTHALLSDSPAVNAGNPAYNSLTHGAFDQRGNARVIGGRIDIGAFERNITFDQTSLPNGNTFLSYSQQLSATRQTNLPEIGLSSATANFAPTSFAVVPVSGQSLPPGLTLSAGGLLSGMPTAGGAYAFTVRATDTDGQAGVQQFTIQVFAPTAASVSISGRILTADGRGLQNALVILTDAAGNMRSARSSSFGFYRFEGIAAGQVYVVSVESKRSRFTPRVVNVTENLSDLDFIARE